MAYPGIRLDREYFIGGAWPDYAKVVRVGMRDWVWRLIEALDLRSGQRVGVLGAAFGFSVLEFKLREIDAQGLELLPWAINEGRKMGVNESDVVQGDATDLQAIRSFAAGARFDVLIDENLSPLLSDEEARAAGGLWREWADQVVHVLSMCCEPPRSYDPTVERDGARHNWHSPSEWRKIFGQRDRIFDFTTLVEYGKE